MVRVCCDRAAFTLLLAGSRPELEELLIDVTSHELRQPVSAIINCSTLVRSNMTGLRDLLAGCLTAQSLFKPTKQLLNTLEEDLEALDSIYQCGLAQGTSYRQKWSVAAYAMIDVHRAYRQ